MSTTLIIKRIVLLMISLSLVACKTFPYSVDNDGIYSVNSPVNPDDMLSSLKRLRGKSVRVDAFRMANNALLTSSCIERVTLLPPKGKTFEQYIHDAFVDELSVVEAVSDEASISISGEIQEIAFENGEKPADCSWVIETLYISSNGKTLKIRDSFQIYGAKQNIVLLSVLGDRINTFEHALRRTMRTTIAHPDFPSLFENPKK